MINNSGIRPQSSRTGFKKITSVRGFDSSNPDNAKQNNYAWSMEEMGEYLYVGTARNIPYSILNNQVLGDVPIPEIFVPENVDYRGEIWRCKMKNPTCWERVYKAGALPLGIGFRFMKRYTSPGGETALYAGLMTLTPDFVIVKSTDGVNWYPLQSNIQGSATRTMIEHNGVLYMGALQVMGLTEPLLFYSTDPENEGWTQVDIKGDPEKNPQGNIDILLSFNNRLYVGTGRPGGFELWRSNGPIPLKDDWTLVVDQGAGDARNEHPWSVAVFQDQIYIGTAIEAAIMSLNPEERTVPPKGFDVIRVDKDDNWELVVGGKPVAPTNPTTGTRGLALSGYRSGFDNFTNAYCWQIETHGQELYLGTFSWSILLPVFVPVLPEILSRLVPGFLGGLLPADVWDYLGDFLLQAGERVWGFDLWKTRNGVDWEPVSLNGLGNNYNYGVRKLFASQNGKLYLGTANPFQGCEVWVKEQQNHCRPTAVINYGKVIYVEC